MPERNTDELLLQKAGAGDPAAFIEIYERHRGPVFRFAYRLSGNVASGEDITHDCFLSLIRKPDNFVPGRGSLRTYLLSAARNLWLKQLRTRGRELALDDFGDDHFVELRSEPLRRVLDSELSLKVMEAVSTLPPLQREALVLFQYEGLSLGEIADLVGVDAGAVKARLHRAREGLRVQLQPYLSTNPAVVSLEKG